MTLLPACRDTRLLALVSIGITVLIAVALAFMRASAGDPFALTIYRHLILYQDYYAVPPVLLILLAALLAPVRAVADALASWCGRHVWQLAAITTVTLAIGAHAVYHVHPLSLDEYAMLFQSKVFVAGKLTGQFPPPLLEWLIPKFLWGQFLKPDAASGAVIAGYWPGFSLLLVPFTALGVPWLLNPLIGGATLLVMHRIALGLFGDTRSAGYVVLLTLASPAVTINALSYYSMPAHLLANAVFMLLLLRPAPGRAFAAGVVGSLALVLHNPLPHALFALPWIVWLALRPDRMRVVGALAAGYLPLGLVLGLGWSFYLQTIGSAVSVAQLATPAGIADTAIQRLRSMFGWKSVIGPQVHLLDLAKLWLWAAPALVAAAAWGAWRLRADGGVWRVMVACAVLTYFGYFIAPFSQGHGWGFRYFHSAWLVLPLLAVALVQPALASPKAASAERSGSVLPGYLAACALLSLVLLTAFRAQQVERFIARQLAQLPTAAQGDARVVFVDVRQGYYAWDLIQNDPFLRGMILFASHGANDGELMAERFPQYRLLSADRRGSVWGIPAR